MGNNKKHLCPCGSGKRQKLCCRDNALSREPSLTPDEKLAMRREVERLGRAGQHLEASELLEQLLVLSPRNPLIWNDLGIQYEAAGLHDRALDALRQGHRCDATYPPILYNLGKFTLDRFIRSQKAGELASKEGHKLLERAATFLNANLDRDPGHAEAHYNLALVYLLSSDEARAEAHATIALRMNQKLELPSQWLLGSGLKQLAR